MALQGVPLESSPHPWPPHPPFHSWANKNRLMYSNGMLRITSDFNQTPFQYFSLTSRISYSSSGGYLVRRMRLWTRKAEKISDIKHKICRV